MALVVAMVTSFHGFLSGMASLKMVPVLRFRNLEVDEILEGPFTNAHELKEICIYIYIFKSIYIHLLYTYTQLDAQKSMSILKVDQNSHIQNSERKILRPGLRH